MFPYSPGFMLLQERLRSVHSDTRHRILCTPSTTRSPIPDSLPSRGISAGLFDARLRRRPFQSSENAVVDAKTHEYTVAMSRSRVTIAAARWWVNWSCVLLSACGLCGAFLLPHATQAPVVRHRHRILSARYPLQHSVRYPVVHGGSKALCRMQVGGDDELQLAVQNLAAQVEDLTAMVKQLADETMATAGKAGAPSQSINGAAVENHAAVPVAASAPSMVKAKSDAERTELVE